MRNELALTLLGLVACGRGGFASIDSASQDGVSGDSLSTHYLTAPGWSIAVLADLTGVVPYHPNDFQDGTTEILDNAPLSVAALYPPFTGELAVAAGRSIIELASDGTTAVHDYRPAVADTTGPDEIYVMTFGDVADVGPNLWLACPSQGNGDGLYYVSPAWQLTRDNSDNNVAGVGFNPAGAYDGIGVPTMYFIAGDMGIARRTDATNSTLVLAGNNLYDSLEVTATALFTTFEATGAPPDLVYRVEETTHATQTVASSSISLQVAEGGELTSTSVVTIRDGNSLVVYANDGTSVVGASSTDPAWRWIRASVPRAPHALAGKMVVLESNRTIDQDRLVVVTPP